MGLSGYTLHLANRIAHSGSHGQTGAVYAGGAPGLILLSKTAEVFCWVLQRKKRKYDSFPACLDAAIPFHEQRHFGTATTLGLHREPLKRCSQMSGRSICMVEGCVRGRSREPSGHRRTHCASMSRGTAVPRERAAPLLVPVPHRRASRFAIAASKCRGELSTIFTHPAARTVLPVPDAAPLCCPAL